MSCEPEHEHAEAASRRKRLWGVLTSRGVAGPLAWSLLIHGIVIFVLVKTMVVRPTAPFTFQGGSGAGDVSEVAGDGLPPPRAEPEAHLGKVESNDSPRLLDIPFMPVPLAQSDSPVASHKSPAELLEPAGEPTLIGISNGDPIDFSPQFPRKYPAGLRTSSPGDATAANSLPPGAVAAAGGGAPSAAVAGHSRHGVDIAPGTGGGTTGVVGGGVSKNKPVPYPALALRRNYQGTVWLRVEIREDGSVGRVAVDESCGYDILDQSALHAVQDWHFPPFEVDGQPIRKEVLQKVEFILPG